MISGHFGVAAVLLRARPRLSPWWLAPAAVAPDLLDIAYALAGVCNPSGLYSHTVPAALLLGACIAGAAVLAGRRETAAASLALVLLHLPLDYVTGRKLLWPGGELHGLRLYDREMANFALEATLLIGGWLLVRGVTGLPRWAAAPWLLVPLLLVQGLSALREDGIKPTACRGPAQTARGAGTGHEAAHAPSWRQWGRDFGTHQGYGPG
ncbi:MAG: hypothetical protein JWL60_2057 [Gemmatimonadetes bacterium]|nr:hypothetical protein [Gemmatimonadota bacterium]